MQIRWLPTPFEPENETPKFTKNAFKFDYVCREKVRET